jgi:hypothetical protein
MGTDLFPVTGGCMKVMRFILDLLLAAALVGALWLFVTILFSLEKA